MKIEEAIARRVGHSQSSLHAVSPGLWLLCSTWSRPHDAHMTASLQGPHRDAPSRDLLNVGVPSISLPTAHGYLAPNRVLLWLGSTSPGA